MQEPPVYVRLRIMVHWANGMRCAEGCWGLKILARSPVMQAQCIAKFNPRKPTHKLKMDARHRPIRCLACLRAMVDQSSPGLYPQA